MTMKLQIVWVLLTKIMTQPFKKNFFYFLQLSRLKNNVISISKMLQKW